MTALEDMTSVLNHRVDKRGDYWWVTIDGESYWGGRNEEIARLLVSAPALRAENERLNRANHRLAELVVDAGIISKHDDALVAHLRDVVIPALPDADKLDSIASWLDTVDSYWLPVWRMQHASGVISDDDLAMLEKFYGGSEMQNDLRSFAAASREALRSTRELVGDG